MDVRLWDRQLQQSVSGSGIRQPLKTVGRPQSLEAAKADWESLLTRTGGNEYGKRKKTRKQTEQKIQEFWEKVETSGVRVGTDAGISAGAGNEE